MNRDVKDLEAKNGEVEVSPNANQVEEGKMKYSRPIVLGKGPSPKHCPIAWDW